MSLGLWLFLFMSVTLTDLIQQVSMGYRRIWYSGVSTAAGTMNTLVCSGLIGRDFAAGNRVQVAGVDRMVTRFDMNTGTVTFAPAHTSVIASNTAFTMTARSIDEMVAAITRAVWAMGEDWQVTRTTDGQTVLDGLRDTWDLPSDCNAVMRVWLKRRPRGSHADAVWLGQVWEPFSGYEVVSVDGVRKLQLREQVTGLLRLQYKALITLPTDVNQYISFGDNDEREPLAFIVAQTLHNLYAQDIGSNPTAEAARGWGQLARQYKEEAERIRQMRRPGHGNGQVLGRLQARQI